MEQRVERESLASPGAVSIEKYKRRQLEQLLGEQTESLLLAHNLDNIRLHVSK